MTSAPKQSLLEIITTLVANSTQEQVLIASILEELEAKKLYISIASWKAVMDNYMAVSLTLKGASARLLLVSRHPEMKRVFEFTKEELNHSLSFVVTKRISIMESFKTPLREMRRHANSERLVITAEELVDVSRDSTAKFIEQSEEILKTFT